MNTIVEKSIDVVQSALEYIISNRVEVIMSCDKFKAIEIVS